MENVLSKLRYTCVLLLGCIIALAQNNADLKVVNAIHGQVIDAETQKSVAGATIEMVCQECGSANKGAKATAVSDANGFYSIKKFVCAKPCASFALTAKAKNYIDGMQFSAKWAETNIVMNFNLFANMAKPKQPLMTRIAAKILKGEKKKTPVVNQKVNLLDNKETVVQSTTTDEFGDFSFSVSDANNGATIELDKNPDLKNEKVYLAKQNGLVVGEFKMNSAGMFRYKILPAEIVTLTQIDVKDEAMQMVGDFIKSDKKEITVMDNLYYESGKWDITAETAVQLDKVANTLKENPKLKLDVYAHTDSKGEAATNLDLSEKRARSVVKYLVSKGVDAKRLSGKGLGETKILNRCTDGVNCSEEEQKLNRRTEFKFVKG